MAAVDYFLKIDGIDGESADAKHKNEIEVESWSWGETQTGSAAHGGGGGAGKVAMQDFHFVVRTSKASPQLMLACATGQHLKMAVLTGRKAGDKQQEFLKFTLTDLLVSSYQVKGETGGDSGGDVVPTDQLSLNFARIEMEYKPQQADGTLDGPVKVGWDLKKNQRT
jgi:type VI secretion system secreted protein Hcp